MARNRLPFELSIARPCGESWAAMQGDARVRHCEHCQKKVHNLAVMTAREIEALMRHSEGGICGRITRDFEGNLVTLDARPKASLIAQVAASAILTASAVSVAAQTPSESKAVLKGQILKADGSGPAVNASVVLYQGEKPVVLATTNAQGRYEIAAAPGVYDIDLSDHFQMHSRIWSAQLHAGEQQLQPIQMQEYFVETLAGDIVAIEHYTFGTAISHPVSYMKYLLRKI